MRYEVVTDQVPLGEGPVWCPDGKLVITSLSPGGLLRIDPASGKTERFVSMPGGANSAALASDGGFVVTNNGGIDFTVFAEALGIDPKKIPYNPGPPGLQRVTPDGRVTPLASMDLQAPNDLVVAKDGTIYFTDPPPHGGTGDTGASGRFWRFDLENGLREIASGFEYDNGVALSPDGRLLIVEARGLLWIDPDSGKSEWWIEQLPGESPGDGFAFDVDGRLYLACPMDHCIRVIDPDGKPVDAIDLGPGAFPTNCCFGGSDRRTLFTTELAPGRVCAIEGLPRPGLEMTPWPVAER
ncbi:MAG: SMP-30/gluconolactonase/LRE family protein [Spirochaetaceae bacterium]|nr:SMP-30/gluconolactonase/LRE family protein [Spirochaetaceae bacterium]HPG28090.1 SMP-30/gluconolactonase/LRE family protein [Myxococcota bacterium]